MLGTNEKDTGPGGVVHQLARGSYSSTTAGELSDNSSSFKFSRPARAWISGRHSERTGAGPPHPASRGGRQIAEPTKPDRAERFPFTVHLVF